MQEISKESPGTSRAYRLSRGTEPGGLDGVVTRIKTYVKEKFRNKMSKYINNIYMNPKGRKSKINATKNMHSHGRLNTQYKGKSNPESSRHADISIIPSKNQLQLSRLAIVKYSKEVQSKIHQCRRYIYPDIKDDKILAPKKISWTQQRISSQGKIRRKVNNNKNTRKMNDRRTVKKNKKLYLKAMKWNMGKYEYGLSLKINKLNTARSTRNSQNKVKTHRYVIKENNKNKEETKNKIGNFNPVIEDTSVKPLRNTKMPGEGTALTPDRDNIVPEAQPNTREENNNSDDNNNTDVQSKLNSNSSSNNCHGKTKSATGTNESDSSGKNQAAMNEKSDAKQKELNDAVNSILEPNFSEDEEDRQMKTIPWEPNLLSNGNWRPTVTPREGTPIHPLDPRGRNPKPIPIYQRKDARLKMPERLYTPRVIPLERIGSTASRDPRLQAEKPIGTPSMERMSRQDQLKLRELSRTTPQYDQQHDVMSKIMKGMQTLHGEKKSLKTHRRKGSGPSPGQSQPRRLVQTLSVQPK